MDKDQLKILQEKLNLVALGEADLSAEEAAVLANSPKLQTFLAESQVLMAALQKNHPADPGEIFFQKQFNDIQQSLKQASAAQSKRSWTWMAVAAVLLLSLGIFRLAPWQQESEPRLGLVEENSAMDLVLVDLSATLRNKLDLNEADSRQIEDVLRSHRQEVSQLKAQVQVLRQALQSARAQGDKVALQDYFKKLRQKEKELASLQDKFFEEVALVLKDEAKQAEFLIFMTDLEPEMPAASDFIPVKAQEKFQSK